MDPIGNSTFGSILAILASGKSFFFHLEGFRRQRKQETESKRQPGCPGEMLSHFQRRYIDIHKYIYIYKNKYIHIYIYIYEAGSFRY